MILVTGAAGYIGSHFLRYFMSKSSQPVLAVDNLSTGHKEALPKSKQVIFKEADIGDFDLMKNLLMENQVKSVVHFAASCYVGESEQNPFKYYNNNLLQSTRLLEAMDAAGTRKIVFSSSCATYGLPQSMPITETHQQAPINTYGQTKLMVEHILHTLKRTRGFSFVALRYFNAAGADESGEIGESHDPETHLIPNVLRALTGKLDCLEIYGDDYETRDGTCIRDYIHVNDLASAHCAALNLMEEKECGLGINLGTSHGASVKEIIELCTEISGKRPPSKVHPRRPGDPPVLVADYAKAKELLAWSPSYDLTSIIKTAWNWEQNRRY